MVLVLMIVHDAMRRETDVLEDAETITAAEMLRAVAIYKQMTSEQPEPQDPGPDPELADPEKAEQDRTIVTDGTVTPLKTGKRGRSDQGGA